MAGITELKAMLARQSTSNTEINLGTSKAQ